MSRPNRRRRLLAATAVLTGLALTTASPATADTAPYPTYHEQYRPQFHFTPARNWMNDPNGLIWYKGRYHLFFQYNPSGNTWGNMSWGHAVSTDLVHWKQLPVAIPQDAKEMIFSGSVVLDKDNTSGLGTAADPPLVAVYTSLVKATGVQRQSLAYSTDGGLTWKKYAGNPVLDLDSTNFRDPKVFWYAPAHRWLMTVALSDQHKVSFYSSPDLEHWTHLSDFGPAGATGGAWECPDLFPLAVDGDPGRTKWVLAVGTQSIAGGTGVQYFVGDFDGHRFASDNPAAYTPPSGTILNDFEAGTYRDWTTTGTAWGSGPATGTLPNQQTVSGYQGGYYASSYHGGDAATGTLTSPAFTVDRSHLNFLVGGGNHPHVDGAGSGDGSAPPDTQTAVNLVVDGKVVRSATGSDSEALDWASWDLGDLQGRRAQIQIVDHNTEGWGHVLADDFTLADAPALSSLQRAHWVDYGEDFYASQTYNDAPGGRRIMLAWMNNWNYGQAIPTAPWRSADTFPRRLGLKTVDGRARLVEQPVGELATLRGAGAAVPSTSATSTSTALGVRGATLELQAELTPGTARSSGLDVRTGKGQRTRIGYDTATGEVYIDRTASGLVDFDPSFTGVQRAPLALGGGPLRLHVLVDASSVEVFAENARGDQVVLTDQVFPDPSSTGTDLFAEGGTATLDHMQAWQLRSSRR